MPSTVSSPEARRQELFSVQAALYTTLRGFLGLEVDPHGYPSGVVRGAVGAVHGRVRTAGHRARIEDQGLVEDIQADRRLGQEALSIIGARNQAKEFAAGTAKETHSH
jgi:hypothetical protein